MDKAQAQGTTAQLIAERRATPRFYLLSRVDVSVPGSGDTYWGGVANISRTGVALFIRQRLKLNSQVTIRLRFHGDDGREVAEALTAKVIWHCGDNAGLAFETPLTAGSPALQQVPNIVAHLVKMEASLRR